MSIFAASQWAFLPQLSLIKLSKCARGYGDEDYNELKKERPIVVIGKRRRAEHQPKCGIAEIIKAAWQSFHT
jgi:hypothetical protein